MHHKILVTGTTSDYIQWIKLSCPARALFITQPDIRQNADEETPGEDEEILVPLSDKDLVLDSLLMHLKKWGQALDGIFCFDCESMELASFIARSLNLDYPSLTAIQNARDKYNSKQFWHHHQVGCPRISPINSVSEVVEFFNTMPTGCVLKPFIGSGSELVFRCISESDCHTAFETIKNGLQDRTENPLFKKPVSNSHLMLAEEHIEGPEYSCDFIVENDSVHVIRMAKKIKTPLKPFGTIQGYILPCALPYSITESQLHETLLKGATALGIKRGLCMVDFIISNGKMMLIEMTPRPGGDCLPHMLKVCAGLDMLKISLDFAGKVPMTLPDIRNLFPCVAIRIHAEEEGILKRIDCSRLEKDKRVKSIHLTKKPGHIIKLPPTDYDSWLLGHVIITPSDKDSPESEALSMLKKIKILIDQKKPGELF